MFLPETFNVFTKNVRGFRGKGWGFLRVELLSFVCKIFLCMDLIIFIFVMMVLLF